MSIWDYRDQDPTLFHLLTMSKCAYCDETLIELFSEKTYQEDESIWGWSTEEETLATVCPICGWWKVKRRKFEFAKKIVTHGHDKIFGAVTCLKQLDMTDISLPLQEVRSYLAAKYDSRFELHPRLFEQTVGSIFEALGYKTLVTGYSNDGGIDVILNDGSTQIGVQVKRYQDSISVEQIRALAGALLLQGMTKGIFVTTSSFQRGAAAVSQKYLQRGYKIELLDAEGFLAALKIAQRNLYQSFDDFSNAHNLEQLQEVVEDIEKGRPLHSGTGYL
jgi:restriction system protein